MRNEGKKLRNKKHDLMEFFDFYLHPRTFALIRENSEFFTALYQHSGLVKHCAPYLYEITTNVLKIDEFKIHNRGTCRSTFRPVGAVYARCARFRSRGCVDGRASDDFHVTHGAVDPCRGSSRRWFSVSALSHHSGEKFSPRYVFAFMLTTETDGEKHWRWTRDFERKC